MTCVTNGQSRTLTDELATGDTQNTEDREIELECFPVLLRASWKMSSCHL